jgi:hypothetical protein
MLTCLYLSCMAAAAVLCSELRILHNDHKTVLAPADAAAADLGGSIGSSPPLLAPKEDVDEDDAGEPPPQVRTPIKLSAN